MLLMMRSRITANRQEFTIAGRLPLILIRSSGDRFPCCGRRDRRSQRWLLSRRSRPGDACRGGGDAGLSLDRPVGRAVLRVLRDPRGPGVNCREPVLPGPAAEQIRRSSAADPARW
jgi:hypothetical protein